MITWITEKIGTSAYKDIKKKDYYILDVRDLVDQRGNKENLIGNKIQEVLVKLNKRKKIVICCDYGISRSNSIAAGVIAKYEGIPFNDAVRQVLTKIDKKSINLSLLSSIRRFIEKDNANLTIKKISEGAILITGGSGFIGSRLIKEFKDDRKVIAPKREEIDILTDIIKLDLFIREKQVGTIVHLANPRIYSINHAMGKSLVMLKNIIDICVENNLKLIFLSTWQIYSGYQLESKLASGDLSVLSGGIFGITKYLCEVLIDHYKKNYKLKSLILRIGTIYGYDRPNFISSFIRKAKNNEKIITHKYINGFPKLDLIYIDDIIGILKQAILNNILGVYNIGSGRTISTAELAQLIVKKLESKSTISHQEIDEKTSNIIMDNTRAETEFDWRPNISIEEGIESMIKKYS